MGAHVYTTAGHAPGHRPHASQLHPDTWSLSRGGKSGLVGRPNSAQAAAWQRRHGQGILTLQGAVRGREVGLARGCASQVRVGCREQRVDVGEVGECSAHWAQASRQLSSGAEKQPARGRGK